MRSPLRAGVGAPGAIAFFAAGFFPAVFFPAGFLFATGFVAAAVVFFPAGFAFFFGGTVDLLSSSGCRGRRTNLTARARISDGGARREGHRRGVLALLVDPSDLDLLTGDLRMDRGAQLVQGVDGLAVDRADDGRGRRPQPLFLGDRLEYG